MYLFRLVTLAALSGALTVPLAAQGIPRNAARSTVNVAPRFMVANPFAEAKAMDGSRVRASCDTR